MPHFYVLLRNATEIEIYFISIVDLILKQITSVQINGLYINHINTIRSFFIRTNKFCLRLAVPNFFFIFEAEMFLICSYFPDSTLQCYKKECQTEYNKNTISFLSFFFFQAAHIDSHWEVFYKKAVLQLQKSSIFH